MNPLELEKLDKKGLTEMIKKLNDQLEIQRARVAALNDKIDKEYQGGKIAETESLITDLAYYEKKIEQQKLAGKQAKETIDSQLRLLTMKKAG